MAGMGDRISSVFARAKEGANDITRVSPRRLGPVADAPNAGINLRVGSWRHSRINKRRLIGDWDCDLSRTR